MLAEGRTPAREAIEALGKDNFYYKQSNKELRRRLRDERAGGESQRRELDEARERLRREGQVQAKLQAELANLRAYLAAHPGATPTRVTKAALKEIAPGAPRAAGAEAGAPRAAWPVPALEPDDADAASPRYVM